ncbi:MULTISPECIES: 2-oxo-tetronate isomerase [Comamonas]|jgi:hydroxypyruvate isomerase|uniref:2-oxo-tetronate isomerase n=1 Tax=Comamonas TaxID=283 RepID=UPI00257BA0AA|nr:MULTISPECIES: 2-oxo-tetronate isomerase [Comamonas]
MPRFAANLSLMYTELPFLARFAAAARDGFQAVEYLFPYAYPAEELAELLDKHGLQQVLFNAPPGGRNLQEMAQAWDAGMRGTLCLNGQEDSFRNGVWEALRYAQVLQCPRIHVMSGLIPNGAARYALRSRVLSNLRWAAQAAADVGVDIMIEPINHRDMPGYYLQTQDQAHSLAQTVAAPNLKVQMDLYHCQITEGDVASKLRQYLPTGRVGHIQIAGVPERQEPDVGELNYRYLFSVIDALGYSGWVGCEYRPRQDTSQGLAWMATLL